MRAFLIFLISGLVSIPWAWADPSFDTLLNKVTLHFNAEQWVTTKTALVTIGVNASVSDSAVENIQNEVLAKLNQITHKGEWHIISLTRNLDQSGLERIQISAQTRLQSSDLGGLRDKAKALSKPGETFTLDNVEFTPSESELRAANTAIRQDIYGQVKAELDILNKLYPDQKYYVYSVDFTEVPPPEQPVAFAKVSAANSSPLAVGDKLHLSATIVLAAAPNADVIKIVHP